MNLPRGFQCIANRLRNNASISPRHVQGLQVGLVFQTASTDLTPQLCILRHLDTVVITRRCGFTALTSSLDHCHRNSFQNAFKDCIRSQQGRSFFSTSRHQTQKSEQNNEDKKTLPFHEGMGLRLVNENGFLSWSRNSYISTVAGVSMLNAAESLLAQGAATGVLCLAGMNMVWGSGSYIVNLLRLRRVTSMSRALLLVKISGVTFHGLLYVLFLLMFSGFFEHARARQRKREGPEINDERWKEFEEFFKKRQLREKEKLSTDEKKREVEEKM